MKYILLTVQLHQLLNCEQYIMLDNFRRGASNILVKAFLGLIALSFILWGVGDIFHGKTDTDVATVNGHPISMGDFNQNLRQETAKVQQRFNGELTANQLKEFQLERITLNRMINRKLVEIITQKMELKAGTEAVLEAIKNDPTFQNERGQFDRKQFNAVLENNRLNEASYVALLKREMTADFLMQALTAQKIVPTVLLEQAYRYKMERRVVEAVRIAHDHKMVIPAMDQEKLRPYYEAHKNMFGMAELRSFSYITLGVDDLLGGIASSESEARTEYDQNISNYQTPEKRMVDNLVFADETQAKNAREKLKNAKNFTEKAKEVTGNAEKDLTLGEVTKADLPQEAGEAVFSLKQGELSQPIQTSLGWHLFRVTTIKPAVTARFEDVRDTIIKAVNHKKAENSLADYAKKLEDEFASGATLEEVAKKFGLKTRKIAKVTQKGETENGSKLEGLLPSPEFLKLVFSTVEGEVSPLTLAPDNMSYFIVRVDKTEAPRARTFEEAKTLVIEAWKQEQQKDSLAKLAEKIRAALDSGKDIKEVAAAENVLLLPEQTLNRPAEIVYGADPKELPRPLLKEVFSMKKKGITGAHKASNGDYIIALFKAVIPADLSKDTSGMELLKLDMGRRFSSDITEEYMRHMHKRYAVKIKEVSVQEKQEDE